MKVLQLGTIPKEEGAFTETGGVATHVWELSNHLSERGHDVCVFAENYFGRSEATPQGAEVKGITPYYAFVSIVTGSFSFGDIRRLVGSYAPLGPVLVLKMIVYYLHISWVVAATDPDIVHAHHLEFRHFAATLVVDTETPLVATSHSAHSITQTEPEEAKKYDRILDRSYRSCDHLIFVSKKLKKELETYFGTFQGHSEVIYNPIKREEREKATSGDSSEFPTLLFVGEFSERKGIYRAIDAISDLEEEYQGLNLIVVGSDETDEVDEYIIERGLSNTVEVAGRVDNIKRYYSNADLLVVPTRSESFGLVFIEAMTHGTPVVGTTGVPKQVIPNNSVGFRVTPDNQKELKRAIREGIQRDWNHETIREHTTSFTWEAQIMEYEQFYTEALNREKFPEKNKYTD